MSVCLRMVHSNSNRQLRYGLELFLQVYHGYADKPYGRWAGHSVLAP